VKEHQKGIKPSSNERVNAGLKMIGLHRIQEGGKDVKDGPIKTPPSTPVNPAGPARGGDPVWGHQREREKRNRREVDTA